MANRQVNIIELEVGWAYMEQGITKLKRILEGLPEPPFTSEEYLKLYTTIYTMCIQKPPHDHSQQLCQKYEKALQDYINSTVLLPTLSEKHGEFLLKEFVKKWGVYKVFARRLSQLFGYLDLYIMKRKDLRLHQVNVICFRDNVLNFPLSDAMIALIDRERKGGMVDRVLLKNVVDVFVEMNFYEQPFEVEMLKDSAAYYSSKASNWIKEASCADYILKAEECLEKERDRLENYLHKSSEEKLVVTVENELFVVYCSELVKKSLDKVEDLSRMYRILKNNPIGLEQIVNIFKQHVTDQITALVQKEEEEDEDDDDGVLFKKLKELEKMYTKMMFAFRGDDWSLIRNALMEIFELSRAALLLEEKEDTVEETGIDAGDIEVVMLQTWVTRSRAVNAIKAKNGDIVGAIMDLTV